MKDTTEKEDDNGEDVADKMNHGPIINVEEVVSGNPAGISSALIDGEAEIVNGDGEMSSQNTSVTQVAAASDQKGSNSKAASKGNEDSQGQGLAGKINVIMAADVETVMDGQ